MRLRITKFISGKDWSIRCSDNCIITSNCNMQVNSVSVSGTGTLTINALIYNFNKIAVHDSNCKLVCRRAEGCFG